MCDLCDDDDGKKFQRTFVDVYSLIMKMVFFSGDLNMSFLSLKASAVVLPNIS